MEAGTVDIKYIDDTVKAMLRTKFTLGLFESMSALSLQSYPMLIVFADPYPYSDYNSTIRTPASRAVLHAADSESIVLLENRANTLPLSKDIGSVALIGPQAGRVSVRSI